MSASWVLALIVVYCETIVARVVEVSATWRLSVTPWVSSTPPN
jgi:hypothetical protein